MKIDKKQIIEMIYESIRIINESININEVRVYKGEVYQWGPSADLEKSINKITADESKKELQRIADELEEDYYSLEDTADFKIPKEMYGDIIKYSTRLIARAIWKGVQIVKANKIEFDEAFSICCAYISEGLKNYNPSKTRTGELTKPGENSSLITYIPWLLMAAIGQGMSKSAQTNHERSADRDTLKQKNEILKDRDIDLYEDLMYYKSKLKKKGSELTQDEKVWIRSLKNRLDNFKMDNPDYESINNKMSSTDASTNDETGGKVSDTIKANDSKSNVQSFAYTDKLKDKLKDIINNGLKITATAARNKHILLMLYGLLTVEDFEKLVKTNDEYKRKDYIYNLEQWKLKNKKEEDYNRPSKRRDNTMPVPIVPPSMVKDLLLSPDYGANTAIYDAFNKYSKMIVQKCKDNKVIASDVDTSNDELFKLKSYY